MAIHLSFVALAFVFSEVRPFGPVAAENVAVDVVTPEEVPDKAPEPAPTPKPQASDALDLSSKPAPDSSPPESSPAKPSQPSASSPPAAAAQPAASQPQPVTPPQQQAAPLPRSSSNPVPTPDRQQSAPQPQTSASAQPPPVYVQPQPDISVKYHVLLGLPQDRPGDAFDAPATENADIEANSIAEFRRHLKSCSTLPKSIAPTDDLAIKLRVALTRDGRLAAEPLLIEAKASMKGPLLIQAAIGALQSCQPYAMLPVEKYNEWKVLDLSFTPSDFGPS